MTEELTFAQLKAAWDLLEQKADWDIVDPAAVVATCPGCKRKVAGLGLIAHVFECKRARDD